MKKIQSTCNYCSLACSLDFSVEDGKIINVVPTKDFPVNAGKACIKGMNLDKQATIVKSDHMPKIDGKEVSWDTATTYTADKLNEIKNKYGSDAIAGLSTGQIPFEEMALLGHVMRNELRANLDGNTRLCMATSVVAYKQSFGFDAPPYTLEDAVLSDTIIMIGANPVVAHPVFWGRIRRSKVENKKVITIDTRKSETAKRSDYFYQIKPKADNILMYTIANILIENDYIDHDYIKNSVNNFEEFKAFVSTYTLDTVEESTGISSECVTELVNLINNGKNVSFWWTMGINQSYDAVRTAQSIINVALITGNMGRPGTGANSITGQCNAMGSRAFSLQAGLFGGGDFTNPNRRKQITEALNITDEYLIDKPTIPYNKIIEEINAGNIKALWVIATNPRHSFINNEEFQKAISKLELFIVQDLYADTDTSSQSSVFLPTAPSIKKEGTLINTERRLSPLRKVTELEEHERTDFDIIYEIGEKLGMGDNLKGFETPQSVFELMKKCSAGMPCDITGITWDSLTESRGIQWPLKEGETLTSDERRLFSDGKYYTENQKANLMFEKPLANPVPINEDYPFILNTGRGTVGQWHTQVRSREIKEVSGATLKDAYILINDNDAQKIGLNELDFVQLESINGNSSKVKVKITENMPEGQVFAPMHYIQTNNLSLSIYDKYSKEPSYKYTPIKISKLEV